MKTTANKKNGAGKRPAKITWHGNDDLNAFLVPLPKVVLDQRNTRLHPVRNIRAITESLKTFGQQKPIVLDDGKTVVAGNGTVIAARELGWSHVAAVVMRDSPARARAFAIADNKTAELAEWDYKALTNEFAALSSEEIDLTVTGFSLEEVTLLSQADWTPVIFPPRDTNYHVRLNDEQMRIVLEAIARERRAGAESDGAALAAICERGMLHD